jgi:hypothetical protein
MMHDARHSLETVSSSADVGTRWESQIQGVEKGTISAVSISWVLDYPLPEGTASIGILVH